MVVNIAVDALFAGFVVVVGVTVLLAVLIISLWDAIDCVRKCSALRRASRGGVEPPSGA